MPTCPSPSGARLCPQPPRMLCPESETFGRSPAAQRNAQWWLPCPPSWLVLSLLQGQQETGVKLPLRRMELWVPASQRTPFPPEHRAQVKVRTRIWPCVRSVPRACGSALEAGNTHVCEALPMRLNVHDALAVAISTSRSIHHVPGVGSQQLSGGPIHRMQELLASTVDLTWKN